MSPNVTITANNFSAGYNRTPVLSLPDISINGRVIAVAGHNGAGKSTFLKAMLGLLPPLTGKLKLNAADGTHFIPEKDMAFCPESGSVFLDIKVQDYLKLWSRLKRNCPKYIFSNEGQILLKSLELDPLLKKKGRELSKGQRQRVQIAAGFIAKPKLFLFDEPFDGLDVQRTQELMQLISSKTDNINFIISSHRMDVIERLADKIIIIDHGKVCHSGEIGEVSKALCGDIFQISEANEPSRLANDIQSNFPEAYVYFSGDLIRIVSPKITESELKMFLATAGFKIELGRFSKLTPSLTDAMGYHLKQLRNN